MPDYEVRPVPWPDDQDADDESDEDVCPECGCHFCNCPSEEYEDECDGTESSISCDECRKFFLECCEEPPCAECALSEDRRSQDVHAEPEPGAADYEPPVPEDDVPF